jgi:hypothetical protein
MQKSYRVIAPFLTDEERREAATGYDGPPVDTSALLGTWTPGGPRKIKAADPMLGGLQRHDLYGGTVDRVTKADRRSKNKAARKSRKANRKRGK